MESDQIKKFRQWLVAQPEFRQLLTISREVEAEIFLIGGLVRDRLLEKDTQDVDITLSRESLRVARIFADRTGGSFVLLRTEGELGRVVLRGRTFDFAKFRGPDLEADLRGRDFTVNAIALSLAQAFREREWVPYDPLNGIQDLRNRVLRMAAADCFEKDPLRMLRAFRFSAQLGLTIDPLTGRVIEKYASSLTQSAPERIHYEWQLLLSQPASFLSLQALERSGLLKVLLPEMEGLKGIEQDRYHHLDVYQHSLLTYHCLEDLIQKVILLPEDLERETASFLKEDIKTAWLKWAALLHDLGKAVTGVQKKGHKTFYGHAGSSQNLFGPIADRYRVSTREKIFIERMIGWHMRPLVLVQELIRKTLTRRALIHLVREIGDELNGIFLLTLADSLAAQGKEKPKDLEDRLKELWRRALFTRDEIIRPLEIIPPLVSGNDLIALGMKPGPVFKTVLSEIQEEQLEGRISEREQALEWVKRRLDLG
ncbi:MAG: HD domain-containing protein [Deltaproteobacteria bacterium]|nr:HD domain-containing protein [Deltaproteobacteria bacterium]